jgi:hypothetical protein
MSLPRALAVLVVASFATPAFAWPTPRPISPTPPPEDQEQPQDQEQPEDQEQPVAQEEPDEPMPEPDEPMPEPEPPAPAPAPAPTPTPEPAPAEPAPPEPTRPESPGAAPARPDPAPAPRLRRVSAEAAVVIAIPTGDDMRDELDTKASTGVRLSFGLDLVRRLRLYAAIRWIFVETGERFADMDISLAYRDLGLGLRYQHEIAQGIHLFGEAEVTSGTLTAELDQFGDRMTERWNGIGGAVRLGAGYRVTPALSLLAAAGYSHNDIEIDDTFDLEVKWWSFDVTAQLRF